MSENRTYCCSNRVQVESIIFGILDLIINVISLGIFFIVAYFYYFEIQSLKDTVSQSRGDFQNTEKFLEAEPEAQTTIIVMLLFMSAIKICSSCVLLSGSVKKNLILLKIWLLPGIILYLYSIIVTFVILYHTRDKLLHGFLGAVYLLFQLYLLWIVKLLTKELSSVSIIVSESQTNLEEANVSATIEMDSKSASSEIESQN